MRVAVSLGLMLALLVTSPAAGAPEDQLDSETQLCVAVTYDGTRIPPGDLEDAKALQRALRRGWARLEEAVGCTWWKRPVIPSPTPEPAASVLDVRAEAERSCPAAFRQPCLDSYLAIAQTGFAGVLCVFPESRWSIGTPGQDGHGEAVGDACEPDGTVVSVINPGGFIPEP
jgi:hypothetical protein